MRSVARKLVVPRPLEPAVQARPEEDRLIEALLFASKDPLDEETLAARLPTGVDIKKALRRLQATYADHGINLVRVGGKWAFRTANDLAWFLARDTDRFRPLSRAALETLVIIAYRQPVTRTEIEDIRGITASGETIGGLMKIGWVTVAGRRRVPGRPRTYKTTEQFLSHFGLHDIHDLPGLSDLNSALENLRSEKPDAFSVPLPPAGSVDLEEFLYGEDDFGSDSTDNDPESV